jgi:hypothetical protein
MPRKRPINLFHIRSVKELEEWQAELHSRPDYQYHGEDLSPEGLEKKLVEHDYIVYARNVPCPMEDIQPGATVKYTLDNGLYVTWLNGTLYVWRKHLEQYRREHPEEE